MVNFPKKEVRITFRNSEISLKQLVELISSIGYEPYISLESADAPHAKIDRKLIYQLAVAGFASARGLQMARTRDTASLATKRGQMLALQRQCAMEEVAGRTTRTP